MLKCDADLEKHSAAFASEDGSPELLQECRGDALTDHRPQSTVRLSSPWSSLNSTQKDTPTAMKCKPKRTTVTC